MGVRSDTEYLLLKHSDLNTSYVSCCSRNGLRDGAVVWAIDDKPVRCWEDYEALAIKNPKFDMTVRFHRMVEWFEAKKQANEIASRTYTVQVEVDPDKGPGFAVTRSVYRSCDI